MTSRWVFVLVFYLDHRSGWVGQQKMMSGASPFIISTYIRLFAVESARFHSTFQRPYDLTTVTGLETFSGSFQTLQLTDTHSRLNAVSILRTGRILVGTRFYGTVRTWGP